jgi:hypothetical protein
VYDEEASETAGTTGRRWVLDPINAPASSCVASRPSASSWPLRTTPAQARRGRRPSAGGHRGLGRPAAGAPGLGRPVGQRRLLPRRLATLRGRRPAMDVDAAHAGPARGLGLEPHSAVAREKVALVRENCRREHDRQRFFDGEVGACINGRTVALGAYFGVDVDGIVQRLLDDQLDGGWNCWTEYGATRSSFHSTNNMLEGLLEHERPPAAPRRRGGPALRRGLPPRTGPASAPEHRRSGRSSLAAVLLPAAVALGRAPSAGLLPGRRRPPDEGTDEVIALLRSKQQPDGT